MLQIALYNDLPCFVILSDCSCCVLQVVLSDFSNCLTRHAVRCCLTFLAVCCMATRRNAATVVMVDSQRTSMPVKVGPVIWEGILIHALGLLFLSFFLSRASGSVSHGAV